MPTLILGLGNPGGEYRNTRHNVGWMCMDEIERRGRYARERREGPAKIRQGSLDGFDVILARPQTYMNLSGRAGVHLTGKMGIDPRDVVVVHDDLDLPFGRLRLKRGGGSAGQKGVESLIASWRTPDFMRVRMGIGRPQTRDDVIDYVLERFEPSEREPLETLVKRAADAVAAIVHDGLDAAMTTFNRVGQ